MSNPAPLLTARDLAKAHGRTPALRGACVELHGGEILAVTGASDSGSGSGSGKSTLLHCLAGIVRPDAGAVTYAGQRLDTLHEKRLSELRRTEFGVVFQFGQLIPELTALDNVALPLLLAGDDRARPGRGPAARGVRRSCGTPERHGRAGPRAPAATCGGGDVRSGSYLVTFAGGVSGEAATDCGDVLLA
ncbi:ATP-binding cassette domain-containing protein [Streptomyces sp. TRM68367]|uniref:ATP-binding cassette domain-containing protein n=1 Tax=Streptomyces sp. TRM68367 TaxID=2758415 RepID=UPI0021D3857C|nr:ATP-binding cassette domain-containing protein [Streptomyces sp. TRM68367]